jgi:hypothetical protein
MDFIADSGYNMMEFRRYFAPGNSMYQIAIKKVAIPKEKWQDVQERFNMKSLARNEDVFGEIVVDNGKKKRQPWDENPLEKFAWVYEWFVDKNDEFRELAQKSAESGDYSWMNNYEFLEKEVFKDSDA